MHLANSSQNLSFAINQSYAISVRGLSKLYGERRSIWELDFDVPRGAICGFVGPNGSGKTTTIRTLLGLVAPSAGQAYVLGSPITEPRKYLDRVGALIEGPAFYPAMSAIANLQILATIGGFTNVDLNALLQQVGLGERTRSPYKSFSLGMKQRLGIAAALIPAPELLILDEPTNGLDPHGIQEIRELIISLANAGRTIFISSHLLSELEAICDYFVMIKAGELIYAGSAIDLLQSTEASLVVTPEFSVDLPHLWRLALAQGLTATIESDSLLIQRAGPLAAEFNRLALAEEIYLREITTSSESLEAKFFDMSRAK